MSTRAFAVYFGLVGIALSVGAFLGPAAATGIGLAVMGSMVLTPLIALIDNNPRANRKKVHVKSLPTRISQTAGATLSASHSLIERFQRSASPKRQEDLLARAQAEWAKNHHLNKELADQTFYASSTRLTYGAKEERDRWAKLNDNMQETSKKLIADGKFYTWQQAHQALEEGTRQFLGQGSAKAPKQQAAPASLARLG